MEENDVNFHEKLYVVGYNLYKIEGTSVYIQQSKSNSSNIGKSKYYFLEKDWELTDLTPSWVKSKSVLWRTVFNNAFNHLQSNSNVKKEIVSKRFELKWLLSKGNKFEEFSETILKLFDSYIIEQYFIKIDNDNFVQFKKVLDKNMCLSFYRVEIYGHGVEQEHYKIETTVEDYHLNKNKMIGRIFYKKRYSFNYNDLDYKIDIYKLNNTKELLFLKIDFPNLKESTCFDILQNDIFPSDFIKVLKNITNDETYNVDNIVKNGFETIF